MAEPTKPIASEANFSSTHALHLFHVVAHFLKQALGAFSEGVAGRRQLHRARGAQKEWISHDFFKPHDLLRKRRLCNMQPFFAARPK